MQKGGPDRPHMSSSQTPCWTKPLPFPCALSAHDANPSYMVLEGHILPGYTHVGLGNARLNNHLSQELRIEAPAGEKSRREKDDYGDPTQRRTHRRQDRLPVRRKPSGHPLFTGLTSAWPGWKSTRLSPKGGSSGGSTKRRAQALATSPSWIVASLLLAQLSPFLCFSHAVLHVVRTWY